MGHLEAHLRAQLQAAPSKRRRILTQGLRQHRGRGIRQLVGEVVELGKQQPVRGAVVRVVVQACVPQRMAGCGDARLNPVVRHTVLRRGMHEPQSCPPCVA